MTKHMLSNTFKKCTDIQDIFLQVTSQECFKWKKKKKTLNWDRYGLFLARSSRPSYFWPFIGNPMVRITLEQYKRLVAIENPSSPLLPALLRPKPPPSLPFPQIRRASSSDPPVVPPPPPLEPPLVPGLLAPAPAREPASSSTAGATARLWPLSLPGARGGARRGEATRRPQWMGGARRPSPGGARPRPPARVAPPRTATTATNDMVAVNLVQVRPSFNPFCFLPGFNSSEGMAA